MAVYEFASANGVDPGDDLLPDSLRLELNYPNPFGPSTTIRYLVPVRSHVRVSVYDVAGRVVDVIQDGVRAEGPHEVHWTGTDSEGQPLSSGVYFVRVEAAGQTKTSKMMLVR